MQQSKESHLEFRQECPKEKNLPSPSSPVSDQRKTNFTLMELLIVVSIIVILAGLLLPALNKARESARCISCAGQAKQLVTANAMYMGDFDDYIYPFYTDFYQQTWVRALEPYLTRAKLESNRYYFSSPQTAKLFLCPADFHTKNGRKDNASCTENSCGGQSATRQSYGINYFFLKGESPERTCKKINEMMLKDSHGNFTVKSGGATLYLSEVKWAGSGHYSTTSLSKMDLSRHGERNNIAFLDGSVKTYSTSSWIPYQNISEGTFYDQHKFYQNFLKR